VINLLITQYTYRFYTKLKTTKKKTINRIEINLIFTPNKGIIPGAF